MLDPTGVLRDSGWGGIAVMVAILVSALGLLARVIYSSSTSDRTRDRLRLLKAFAEQARLRVGDLGYLSPGIG